jgi:hypothetical protein
MPGIAGLIGNIRKEEGLRRVEAMLQAMTYEPFYSTGVYSNEQLGVYAGWVVHPNSFSDCMPVRSADGRTIQRTNQASCPGSTRAILLNFTKIMVKLSLRN